MNLKAFRPVLGHGLLHILRGGEPLPTVAVRVAVLHLHQLREESSVCDDLDVVPEHDHFVVTEGLRLSPDLFYCLFVAAHHGAVNPKL